MTTSSALRRLKLIWAELKDLDKVRELAGQPEPRPRDVRLGELRDLARSASIDPSDLSQRDGYATVVRAAGKYILVDPDTAR